LVRCFFTDTFELAHAQDQEIVYELTKRVPSGPAIEAVTVDGVLVPYVQREGLLEFQLTRALRGSSLIEVRCRAARQPEARVVNFSYQAGVAVRRALSEMRDNVLCHSRALSRIARMAVKTLRQSTN
jgi:hypothetical protein